MGVIKGIYKSWMYVETRIENCPITKEKLVCLLRLAKCGSTDLRTGIFPHKK